MNTHRDSVRRAPARTLPICLAITVLSLFRWNCLAEDATNDTPHSTASRGLVPLILKLPLPVLNGTPKDIKIPGVEPLSDKLRPPMMVPAGLRNIAGTAKLTCSDPHASAPMLAQIVDGNKEANEGNIVALRKGMQWVQMDFGGLRQVFAIVIWHCYDSLKVYHDVIVQAADDPSFTQDTKTLFNNDADNSSGLGVGTDREYFESFQGKLINARGIAARYLRFYSKGSTESAFNEYIEIEVYGRPVK